MSIKATGDGRVLLFYAGVHANAVSVNDVERVLRAVELVAIPDMPPHLEGLLNLRGEAVPVINLHYRLDISTQELDPEDFLIILRHASGKIAVRSATTPVLKESEGDYSDDLTNSGACPELLKSVIKIDGAPVPVYNPDKLFQPEDAAWESLKTFWNDVLAKR
ncbi:MAG: chemotaxis protein CheW [Victivallaceae bacterium]